MEIIIRNINLETDIQGIREAHGDDDHWGSDEVCFGSTQTSLENGFFIQVATYNDKIVGHAEWVLSDELYHRFLYLGMLQIHESYQKRGIGTKLIESGALYAKEKGCTFLRTMPDEESGSISFYEKNGFIQTNSNNTLELETISADDILLITRFSFICISPPIYKRLPFLNLCCVLLYPFIYLR